MRLIHLELRSDIERYYLTQLELLQLRFVVSSANVKFGQQCLPGKKWSQLEKEVVIRKGLLGFTLTGEFAFTHLRPGSV